MVLKCSKKSLCQNMYRNLYSWEQSTTTKSGYQHLPAFEVLTNIKIITKKANHDIAEDNKYTKLWQ